MPECRVLLSAGALQSRPNIFLAAGSASGASRVKTISAQPEGFATARSSQATAFRSTTSVSPENLHPISDSVSFGAAALLDCYACGVHAMNRSPVPPGKSAAIIGAGAIAMTLGQVLKASGVERVVMSGTRPEPLEVAIDSGAADKTVCIADGDPVEGVMDATDGEGSAVTYETVGGRGQLISQAMSMTRSGGTVSVLGLFTATQEVDPALAMQREVSVRWSNSFSSWNGKSEFVEALELMESGKLNPDPIMTHEFPIAQISEAFTAADNKAESGAIRVMVIP